MKSMSYFRDAGSDFVRDHVRPMSGIAPGAMVRSFHGDRQIETLHPGDRVFGMGGAALRIEAITRHIACARNLLRIAPNALGRTQTGLRHPPLVVVRSQRLVIDGWLARAMFGQEQMLVCAEQLVEGELIRPISGTAEIPVFQLHLTEIACIAMAGLQIMSSPPVPL